MHDPWLGLVFRALNGPLNLGGDSVADPMSGVRPPSGAPQRKVIGDWLLLGA